MEAGDRIMVFITAGSREEGERIARALVEERYAACGNLIAPVTSIYRWKGEIKRDEEVLLVLKTVRGRFEAIMKRVREMHSYELPEIIAVSLADGLPDYLKWIGEETS